MTFDPNTTGNKNLGVFSLPFTEEDAKLVLLPVPWEVTTSYGDGCSLGPEAIFEASKQLDLCDSLYGSFYEQGIFQRPTNQEVLESSRQLKAIALRLKEKLENGLALDEQDKKNQAAINEASMKLNQSVYLESKSLLDQNKLCGLIGGDHSSPFGLIKALAEKHADLSILHIDAHMDLREAYQGYQYSHASIMNNVMTELNPHSLVQLGIRDFCPQEQEMEQSSNNIHTFYDSRVTVDLASGNSWKTLCEEALSKLSDSVYISFDIDGLSPDLCPSTGTPVPGGLSFSQAESLLYFLSTSGKKVVGFDLCEVSPGPNPRSLDCWDANVGARILFKLAGCLLSNNK